ncbi:MAG TPA: ATP-binding protein [Haliangium sp.]|nr:ATP-binding protein [Haliangium sp.]
MALFGDMDDLDPTVAPGRAGQNAPWAAAREPGFRRHMLITDMAWTLAELGLVALPLWLLFDLGDVPVAKLARVIAPVAVALCALWLFVLRHWLAPVLRALAERRRGQPIEPDLARAAYQATLRLPLRILILRTALWSLGALCVGLFLAVYDDRSPRQAAEMASIAVLHAWAVNILRALWYGAILSSLRLHLYPERTWLERFTDGYFGRLVLVAAVVFGGTLAAFSSFVYFFLPISGEQYLLIQIYFPAAAVLGIAVWVFIARLNTESLRRYLASRAKLSTSDSDSASANTGTGAGTETGAAAGAGEETQPGTPSTPRVYRLAQSLPYRLSGTSMALWSVLIAAGSLLCSFILRLEQDDTVLMIGVGVVTALGAAIYETLWHRDTMRLLLAHLTVHRRLPVRRLRGTLSLRSKLLLSFGGLVMFACGLALFWSFAQYKNLVTDFVSRQAGLSLGWLRSEVNGAAALSPAPPTSSLVIRAIHSINRPSIEANAIFYYLPGDAGAEIMAVGGGTLGAPQLPWYVGAQLRLPHDVNLDIDSLALSGRAGRVRVPWKGRAYDLGTVAVLYPDYRGRGASMVRPLKELVLFFVALFGACAGIVVLTVGQFVRPIRWLERRADGMARGDLAEPVSSGGEGDEIGRLTFALEDMRQALQEKLRSTEEINIELESAVQRRTADLARKNRELAETLDKLTRAQDQLVRAEKMASIGQLVAGIAHEINNPVNAIVNTVGPLEEAAAVLGDPGDEQSRAEARADVREMIRVIKRGAERTKAIVRALHNYSRTDDDQLVEFDLNRSIDDSLELLRHMLKPSNIEVERDYAAVGRIRGHAGQLNQVFMNLLTNAAQALSGREGARIRVETRAPDGQDERVEIRVIDNGKGISPGVLPRIFDPFFTTKEVGEGTGLGLSIVHELVERHGGTIAVESQVDVGTVFTVTLPRSPEHALSRDRKVSEPRGQA